MGLAAEPSPPAQLAAQTNSKMSDAKDESGVASPLPVSSCGVLPASREAEKKKKEKEEEGDVHRDDDDDAVNFRGRNLPPVGQDPLAAAAAAASAKISETAHRAAELTLGAVAPGTTPEDLVRASKESLWGALAAARTLAAGAVAAAASASDAAVEGTRQQVHAAVSAVTEAAKEASAAAAAQSGASSNSLESYRPADGSAVLGAFHAELRDEIISSTSSSSLPLFPPAPRRIRGALFVTSSSVHFLVSRAHQLLGRAVSAAVSASAADASAAATASLGAAGCSELGGFLAATLAAEDAERAATEAEEAAGLPAAGTVAVVPLAAIERAEVVGVGSGSGGDDGGALRNSLVLYLKGKAAGSVRFAAFGAPSDADEALALVEHLLGEGGEAEKK